MLLKKSLYVLTIAMCMHVNLITCQQLILMHQFNERYGVLPEISCNSNNYSNKETYLQALLKPFNSNLTNVKEESLYHVLQMDEQDLLRMQKNLPTGWFYREEKDQQTYDKINHYLTNLREIRCLLIKEIKEYIRIKDIIDFYKNMPHDTLLVDWIKNQKCCGVKAPLQEYKNITQRHLRFLDSLHPNDFNKYPSLHNDFKNFDIFYKAQNSLRKIEGDCAQEQIRVLQEDRQQKEYNARIALLQAQSRTEQLLQEQIKNDSYLVIKNAENLAMLRQTERELLCVIEKFVNAGNYTKQSIRQHEKEINELTNKIQNNEKIYQGIYYAIVQHQQQLKIRSEETNLLDKIDRLKYTLSDLNQKIKAAQDEKNKLERQFAKNNDKALTQEEYKVLLNKYDSYKQETSALQNQAKNIASSINTLLDKLSPRRNQPPIAEAEPISGYDTKNIPSAQAQAIPVATATYVSGNQDQTRKENLPRATQILGCDQHLNNPQTKTCQKCSLLNSKEN